MSPDREGRTCLVFGAGALGLGFLGPELGDTYEMVYADIPAKADLLAGLSRHASYTFNETGPAARAVIVEGVSGIIVTDGGAVAAALDAAEIVLTAVGEPNLPKVAPALAAAALRRTPQRPLRILCSENGLDIASKLTRSILSAAGSDPGERLLVGDTTMGRMCQIVDPPAPGMVPIRPGLGWAVCAEPFFGIPCNAHVASGLDDVPPALQPMADAEFAAQEDVKMWAHNGLHAFLAFLGTLRGVEFFCDLAPDTIAMASDMMRNEVGPALLRKHGAALDRNFWHNYAPTILRRIICPGLHDAIARGTRGAMRKLHPRERLISGLRGIAGQGIEPALYATGVAAAIMAARAGGETDMDLRQVLTDHCGLNQVTDADLIELVEQRRRWLVRAFVPRQ